RPTPFPLCLVDNEFRLNRFRGGLAMRLFLLVALMVLSFAAAPPAAQEKQRTPKTDLDQAVDGALAYLAANQDREGAWSASYRGKNPAITALAVMAFLSAGHIPGEGRYGDIVQRGIEYVL